jgi:hypothetical protein
MIAGMSTVRARAERAGRRRAEVHRRFLECRVEPESRACTATITNGKAEGYVRDDDGRVAELEVGHDVEISS